MGDARPLALVTGASSGIGAAYAHILAEHGHDLVLVARRGERLEQLAASIEEVGARSELLVADLSDRSQLQGVLDRAASGDIDLLVSNAGVSTYERLDELSSSEVEAAWTLNADATPLLSRAALPAMLERGRGGIIATASTLAFSAGLTTLTFENGRRHELPHRSLYAGAKAGMVAFMRTLATELEGSGVTATVVCPGLVASEWNQSAARTPVAMAPDDVARAAWQAHLTGETICFPGLEELSPWNTLMQAESEIVNGSNRPKLANRY
jgi:short-subunit dehydrogenase